MCVSALKMAFARWETPRKRIQKSGSIEADLTTPGKCPALSRSRSSLLLYVLPEVDRMRFVAKFAYPGVLAFAVEYCRAWSLFAAVASHGSTRSGAEGTGVLWFRS